MDDLNMANAEPAATLPPEASSGDVESSAAQPPAADAPAEQMSSPAQEQPSVQPAGADRRAPAVPDAGRRAESGCRAAQPEQPQSTAVEEASAEGDEPKTAAEEKPKRRRKRSRTKWIGTSSRCKATARSRSAKASCAAWPSPAWDTYFDEVIVPTEKVTEFKGGKKKVIKRKLYPGYLVVHMEINDDTWFLVRETPGIGDFTGAAGRPSPMLPHEVARIVAKQEEKSEKAPKLKIAFREGERVKIKEGTFENFEGEVESIDETNGRVTVMINIFGRSTPVELEYWQIETL